MLPHRDQYGRRVYIYRPGKWNPDKVHFNDVFCTGYSLCELVAPETKTQIAGVTCIADAEGFGFKQLRNFTLEHARNATNFVQDSFPLWFRVIHVINAPRLFYLVTFMAVLRSFRSKAFNCVERLWYHLSFQLYNLSFQLFISQFSAILLSVFSCKISVFSFFRSQFTAFFTLSFQLFSPSVFSCFHSQFSAVLTLSFQLF